MKKTYVTFETEQDVIARRLRAVSLNKTKAIKALAKILLRIENYQVN